MSTLFQTEELVAHTRSPCMKAVTDSWSFLSPFSAFFQFSFMNLRWEAQDCREFPRICLNPWLYVVKVVSILLLLYLYKLLTFALWWLLSTSWHFSANLSQQQNIAPDWQQLCQFTLYMRVEFLPSSHPFTFHCLFSSVFFFSLSLSLIS